MTPSAEHKQSESNMELMYDDRHFIMIYEFFMLCEKVNNVCMMIVFLSSFVGLLCNIRNKIGYILLWWSVDNVDMLNEAA